MLESGGRVAGSTYQSRYLEHAKELIATIEAEIANHDEVATELKKGA